SAAAQKEAVVAAAGLVTADDLSRGVDAQGFGQVFGIQGIDKRGVSASTQQEAVDAGGGPIKTHDVTRGVDAGCNRREDGRGIVQGREGKDWHGAASLSRLGERGGLSGRRHACCGAVSNVCCDASVPSAAIFMLSPAPLPAPKLAIACTSCPA